MCLRVHLSALSARRGRTGTSEWSKVAPVCLSHIPCSPPRSASSPPYRPVLSCPILPSFRLPCCLVLRRQHPCERGHWCVGGVRAACPAGRYGSGERAVDPLCSGLCAAGYYCPEASIRATQFPCGGSDRSEKEEQKAAGGGGSLGLAFFPCFLAPFVSSLAHSPPPSSSSQVLSRGECGSHPGAARVVHGGGPAPGGAHFRHRLPQGPLVPRRHPVRRRRRWRRRRRR